MTANNSMTRANYETGTTEFPPVIVGPITSIKAPSGVPYSNPAGSEYPVIANNNYLFKDESKTTDAQIQKIVQGIKGCGFNVNIWYCEGLRDDEKNNWTELISRYYKIASSLKLPTLLNLTNATPVVVEKLTQTNPPKPDGFQYGIQEKHSTMKDYADVMNLNPNDKILWGYRLKDEPSYEMWGYRGFFASVGTPDLPAAYRTYLLNAHRHIAFFNLLAVVTRNAVGSEIFDSTTNNKNKYKMYLKAFKDKFNPSLMSVDIYPIMDKTADKQSCIDFNDYFILKRYYYILEAIGEFSTEYNIPFWMYMMSTQHTIYQLNGTVQAQFPEPKKNLLRFQAMNAIAFGFQGVVFWNYGMQTNKTETNPDTGEKITIEEFHNAPIDGNGEKTEVWDECKAVIPEIKSYGKELLNAKFREARHVYGPFYKEEFEETTRLTSSIGCISGASTAGNGFAITRLTKGSDRYLAIVSHDPYGYQNITLTIASGYNPVEIEPAYPDSVESVNGINMHIASRQTLNRTLRPGGMILIRY